MMKNKLGYLYDNYFMDVYHHDEITNRHQIQLEALIQIMIMVVLLFSIFIYKKQQMTLGTVMLVYLLLSYMIDPLEINNTCQNRNKHYRDQEQRSANQYKIFPCIACRKDLHINCCTDRSCDRKVSTDCKNNTPRNRTDSHGKCHGDYDRRHQGCNSTVLEEKSQYT